jgi:ribulose-phosphate 3-epimerase
VTPFATRIHVDLADGRLAPTTLLAIDQTWLPEGKTVDFHLMYQQPKTILGATLNHHPSLIIVHAEADDAAEALQIIRNAGCKAGIALLPGTSVVSAQALIKAADHVLVFGGNLGYQGGTADLALVEKIGEIKILAPQIEIGWDGGVNDSNASQLSAAGVAVLNVGAYIQHADDPATAYAKLLALAEA